MIAGHAELMSVRDDPELRRAAVAAIGDAARRLGAILDDLEEQLERGRSAEAAAEADEAHDRHGRFTER